MPNTKPKLLELERIALRNADLYLYPEYATEQDRFQNVEQDRTLGESSRKNKVMTPTNGEEPFVVKTERPEGDGYRRAYEGKCWIPVEKEVAVARALSLLASTEFADMRVVFEEPYGLIVTDEGKSGLFKLYPSHQDELGVESFDNIRRRIKTEKPVRFQGKKGWVQEIQIEFEGEKVATRTIVNRIEGLYHPNRMGEIVMETNGVAHPDYKTHNYQVDGKPTALISDFEMVYLVGQSGLAGSVAHTWKYLTEMVSAMNSFTFEQLLDSSDTIEGMVHQRNYDPFSLRSSARELQGLRDRREEIYNLIVGYTGMQSLDDQNIIPGPAFEVISHIKHTKPSDLL